MQDAATNPLAAGMKLMEFGMQIVKLLQEMFSKLHEAQINNLNAKIKELEAQKTTDKLDGQEKDKKIGELQSKIDELEKKKEDVDKAFDHLKENPAEVARFYQEKSEEVLNEAREAKDGDPKKAWIDKDGKLTKDGSTEVFRRVGELIGKDLSKELNLNFKKEDAKQRSENPEPGKEQPGKEQPGKEQPGKGKDDLNVI